MIYWWLFNSWVGIMSLAEFSKQDGVFGNPTLFWWSWMSIATIASITYSFLKLRN